MTVNTFEYIWSMDQRGFMVTFRSVDSVTGRKLMPLIGVYRQEQ